jgi:Lysozyme inhibitor LprI
VPGESTIIFRADRIEAPDPFGCAKPKYEFKMITADKLFGGRLEKPAQEDLGFDARISSCSTRAAVWTCYKRLIGKSEPAIAASYRKIQRAWIAYRDARCAHPQIEFQGSMAGPMEAFCQMQATADQSLWLGTGED